MMAFLQSDTDKSKILLSYKAVACDRELDARVWAPRDPRLLIIPYREHE